ncbi:hypothetical protein AB6A40_000409 [Gnathostoma spinigerum]|uniref:Uncharacterized protein n=1 Tax=Gnathostoma spinigerum TaxID=75299 RepID=A0ABD6E224_9BILA
MFRNERAEQLEVNAWLKYSWKDDKLRWNPSEYGNISDMRHPAGSIWQPDVLLYNSVDSAFDTTYKSNIVGYSDGSLTWIPPGILKISCKIDIYWFPFDEQICYFKFGSWTFNGREIDLQPGDFDMSEYIENGEWAVLRTWDERTERFYECCPEPYPDVKFFIHLRRRTLYYAFNLILPCLLILILVVIGFSLRPETCEKVGLQISVALANTVFLTIMNEMTPPTSEAVPLLGLFFESCMVISVAATAFTVYVQAVHFRSNDNHRRMGFWMRYLLIEWCPYLLLMSQPRRQNNLSTLKQTWRARKKQCTREDPNGFLYDDEHYGAVHRLGEILQRNLDTLLLQIKVGPVESSEEKEALKQHLTLLHKIYNHVKLMREKSDDDLEQQTISYEWKFAAMVFDRLGLLFFAFVIIVTCFTVGIRAPYLNA